MKLGVMLEGQDGLTWDLWRRIMARVEELGFESLWCSDHFMSIVDSNRDVLETWVALTLTAAETTRLRFGSLVCPMTFRHPSLLARMAAAVDTLSGGRLVLGVGAGWNEHEHRAFGIPFPPLQERMHMLVEGIEVIGACWVTRRPTLLAAIISLTVLTHTPNPSSVPASPCSSAPRVWSACSASWRAMPMSGTCQASPHPPLTAPDASAWPHTAARSTVIPTISVIVSQRPTSSAAMQQELRRRGETMQQLIPDLAAHDPGAVPDVLRAEGWLVGTPDQIIVQLQALAHEGVERVIFQHNDQTDFDALELLAHDVLPVVATWP